MANIVLGIATSRSPMISIPPELLQDYEAFDAASPRLVDHDGRPVAYPELLDRPHPDVTDHLTLEHWKPRHQAAQDAIDALAQAFADARPDVAILVGDDEEVWIHPQNRPSIMLFGGATYRVRPREVNENTPSIPRASAWSWGDREMEPRVDTGLAEHLARWLVAHGFDTAYSTGLPEGAAISHSFGYLHQRIMRGVSIPTVPIIMNDHYPPNQPTPARCYGLGLEVRKAVEAWQSDARVAIMGAGGLSTGVVNQELDRRLLEALRNRDADAIAGLPETWFAGLTGETRNWLVPAGASQHLRMDLLEYMLAYRTRGGTGCGLAFARWQ